MTPCCIVNAWNANEAELRAFLLVRVADMEEVDDLLQELFIKLAQQGQGFCAVKNPRAWLFCVARHFLADRYRTKKVFVELDPNTPSEVDYLPPITELEACLERNLALLPASDRRIIEACDLQNQRQQSYARQYGLTLSATKSRLLRARQKLKDKIIKNCQVKFDEKHQVCCHKPK